VFRYDALIIRCCFSVSGFAAYIRFLRLISIYGIGLGGLCLNYRSLRNLMFDYLFKLMTKGDGRTSSRGSMAWLKCLAVSGCHPYILEYRTNLGCVDIFQLSFKLTESALLIILWLVVRSINIHVTQAVRLSLVDSLCIMGGYSRLLHFVTAQIIIMNLPNTKRHYAKHRFYAFFPYL
jgi:hypothetical protein